MEESYKLGNLTVTPIGGGQCASYPLPEWLRSVNLAQVFVHPIALGKSQEIDWSRWTGSRLADAISL